MKNIQFQEWIDSAPEKHQGEFRRAVHVVISAISLSPVLPDYLVMKGGMLLAIAHSGERFTKDIDFSTSKAVAELPVETVVSELRARIPEAVEMLEYDLDCRVQSYELRPPDPAKSWPTLIVRIGYAPYSEPRRLARLAQGASPTLVRVECSYNEAMSHIESLEIAPGKMLNAYTAGDVIAEKLRAIIQQPVRNRFRRQDIYDIYMLLLEYGAPTPEHSEEILASLKDKAESRKVQVDQSSLRDDEVRARSENEYLSLRSEIQGELPDFEIAYEKVRLFYEGLPW